MTSGLTENAHTDQLTNKISYPSSTSSSVGATREAMGCPHQPGSLLGGPCCKHKQLTGFITLYTDHLCCVTPARAPEKAEL